MVVGLAWVAWVLPQKRWFAMAVFALCFLGAIALWLRPNTMTYFNPFGRFAAWSEWLDTWAGTLPIIGLGLGAAFNLGSSVAPDHVLRNWTHAHNEYLQLLVEFGIIGV